MASSIILIEVNSHIRLKEYINVVLMCIPLVTTVRLLLLSC